MRDDILKEIEFCIEHREQKGRCKFGEETKCEQCASIYVLRKLYNGKVLDGQKLTLNERKKKVALLKDKEHQWNKK